MSRLFNGTFIQSWLSREWDDECWQTEIDFMKEAGIKYVILQDLIDKYSDGSWEVFYDSDIEALEGTSYYGYDVLDTALYNCQKNGMKVIIGLALDEAWSTYSGFSTDYMDMCDVMTEMVEEIYTKYYPQYSDTIYGWYFTPEIAGNVVSTLSINSITKGLNKVIDVVNTVSPDLPIILSPYMFDDSAVYTAVGALPLWMNFFNKINLRDGDIFCPQDSVGCNVVKTDSIEEVWRMYSEAMKSCKADIKLWANCENFTLGKYEQKGLGMLKVKNKESITSTLDRFVKQMDIASRYAENIITFSYNHYYCPADVRYVFNDTYLDYISNGYTLEKECPEAPTEFTAEKTDGGVLLSWNDAQDNIGIAYYNIYVNGRYLAMIESQNTELPTSYIDTSLRLCKTTYTIEAVDGAGNISQTATVKLK